MGYSAENYHAVSTLLEERRKAAIRESERRRTALHEKSPEAAEIDRALSRTGVALFRAACEGGREGAAFQQVMQENQALQEARAALLAQLGLPRDYTEVHYTCPLCGDTGYVDIHMCQCMRRELVLAGFRSSGLGGLIDRQTFDNFSLDYYRQNQENLARMEKTLAIVRRYAEEFTPKSGNLLFLGRTGLGKTHLSTAIARTVIERGYDVRYESAPEAFAAWETSRFKARDAMEEYAVCDLLILDDLGSEAITQYTLSCLYTIINARIGQARPTIISTNLGYDALQERYNDRITSRLIGEFSPLLFVGEDIRRQKLTRPEP